MTAKIGEPNAEGLRGFDDYVVSLGDIFRGERATLGLSLLDVQRDLRIKAEYLAAIEDANPDGFDGKGFIAGYVRSYARHVNLDPEWAFQKFCNESGFKGVHGTGMSVKSSKAAKKGLPTRGKMPPQASLGRAMPRIQSSQGWFQQLDSGALGSIAVLLALIIGLGYGAWSVVTELQRVTVIPVDATPELLTEVDPLAPVSDGLSSSSGGTAGSDFVANAPSIDALDRLYRPQALDTPVLMARDGPISAIDPNVTGALVSPAPPNFVVVPELEETTPAPMTPQVVEEGVPEVVILAVAPAWVRVRAADGTVLLEKVLQPGERYALPATEEPPTLRAGAAGSVFFEIGDKVYGPAGDMGSVASNVILEEDALRADFALADLTAEPELAAIVNVADAGE